MNVVFDRALRVYGKPHQNISIDWYVSFDLSGCGHKGVASFFPHALPVGVPVQRELDHFAH